MPDSYPTADYIEDPTFSWQHDGHHCQWWPSGHALHSTPYIRQDFHSETHVEYIAYLDPDFGDLWFSFDSLDAAVRKIVRFHQAVVSLRSVLEGKEWHDTTEDER